MTNKDYFYIGLITVLIGIFVIQDIMGTKEKPKPEILYEYYPEYIEVEKPYSEVYKKDFEGKKPKDEKTTPPLLTKNFETETNNNIIIKNDSSKFVLVDTITKEEFNINNRFLSLFPNNDKLINFILSQDTLSIVTLNTEGNITDKTYPLYLQQFRYRFYDNTLHHYPIKQKESNIKTNRFNQLYINTGYDFIKKSPNISLDYLININRFRIMAGSELELNTGTIRVNTKLGYRIF